jgi:hypothetical protein
MHLDLYGGPLRDFLDRLIRFYNSHIRCGTPEARPVRLSEAARPRVKAGTEAPKAIAPPSAADIAESILGALHRKP